MRSKNITKITFLILTKQRIGNHTGGLLSKGLPRIRRRPMPTNDKLNRLMKKQLFSPCVLEFLAASPLQQYSVVTRCNFSGEKSNVKSTNFEINTFD